MTIPIDEEEVKLDPSSKEQIASNVVRVVSGSGASNGASNNTDDADSVEETPMLFERSELQLQESFETRPQKARKITQILAVVAVSVGAFIHGTTVTFPAVAIPSILRSNGTNLTAEDAVMAFHVTTHDISLIVSIASVGMLLGSLMAGPCANLIGRKWTSIFGTFGSLALGYSLVASAQWIWMMFLGRFLHGVGLGFSTTVSTIYIMEIATPEMRGGLAVLPAIAGTLGLLTVYCVGAILNWQWLATVCASLCAPLLLMLIFIPESPVYLIATEQIERAHKVLRVLRGPHWNVTAELTDIKVASEGRETYHVKLSDFTTRTVLKPLLIALTLMFFFQFSGINVVLQYTVDVFQSADSSIDEFYATILVGTALLLSNLITLMVANRMPRRLMLILSSLGISLALIGMGVYFYLKTLERVACGQDFSSSQDKTVNGTVLLNGQFESAAESLTAQDMEAEEVCPAIYTESFGWLPLLLMMMYIFFFNLGYGAMIWITVVEILPLHVRSVATSLSVGFTCLCSFLTSHTYTFLKTTLKSEGVFWLYGSASFLGLLFIVISVPETKGKTEAEIREYFKPKKTAAEKSKSKSCPRKTMDVD